MDKSQPIAPAIQKFLHDALPNDGGNHSLVLGEAHSHTEHLDLLQNQLDDLHKHHHVQTLGLERSSYFNLFLWAYRDGQLTEMLGSQQAARDYLKAIFAAYSPAYYKENASKHAELTIQALDAGMDVIAFDSRDSLPSLRGRGKEYIKTYNAELSKLAERKGKSIDSVIQEQRTDLTHALVNKDDAVEFLWMLAEAQALRTLYPEYGQKLKALEKLVHVGHQKIADGKLTSDALSAITFNSLAGKGNRITVIGSAHLTGIGSSVINSWEREPIRYDKEDVHGTFGVHLFSAGQLVNAQRAHTVTQTVIASVASVNKHNVEIKNDYRNPNTLTLAGHRVAWLNLDNGTTDATLWHPEDDDLDDPRIVPLEEKFPPAKAPLLARVFGQKPSASRIAKHQAAHINPLLMPDIKQAADAVRAAMNGEEKGAAL